MNTLRELLTQKDILDPERWFEDVCNLLFYKTVFHVGNQRFKITEAELYLNDKDNHPDVFTHGSKEQEKTGLFYFHKNKGGVKFKEFPRSGIDITFGNENRFGGILLRGMQNLDCDSDYLDGPAKVSQKVVEALGVNKVKDIASTIDINISNSQDLWFEDVSGENQSIYKVPRIGLSLSNNNVKERLPYISKLYRYLAAPLKTKKW